MELTDKGMRGAPASSDRWLKRSFGRGCGVLEGRIMPSGERRFYFRYTGPDGERVRLPIGSFSMRPADGGLTLAEAGKVAAEWSRIYQAGARDLRGHLEAERTERERQQREAAERASAPAALTVRQLFERWREVELAERVGVDGKRIGRKDGGEYLRKLFDARVFQVIGDRAAEAVGQPDVLAILDQARTDGRLRTANILLASLKQMFRFAAQRRLVPHSPAEALTRREAGGRDATRERVLSDKEIRALPAAIARANLPPRSAAAVWLILSTAVRVSEAMTARWEHVDLKARRWTLPETKNQRSHVVHLSDFAARQFQVLEALRPPPATGEDGHPVPCAWVFPNLARDGHIDIPTFGKQLSDRQRPKERRLKNRVTASDALLLPGGRWTSHDLRRTAASLMAELGVSGDVIDECLNHVIESKVRRIYVRNRRLDAQAKAFDLLGARLHVLMGLRGD